MPACLAIATNKLVYDRQLESLCKKTGVLVSTHIVYRYKEVEEDIDIRLVLNRVPEGCLTLGQGPNSLDYLLKVRSGIVDLKSVIQTIRTSKLVTLATLLDPNKSGVLEAMFELE